MLEAPITENEPQQCSHIFVVRVGRQNFLASRAGKHLMQLHHQRVDRIVVFQQQNRLFLARCMTYPRRQRCHGSIAVGQDFSAHNGIDGGGLAGLHCTDYGQYHLQAL
ncbi:hypothetical protein D3C79_740360 [compost metagenome]